MRKIPSDTWAAGLKKRTESVERITALEATWCLLGILVGRAGQLAIKDVEEHAVPGSCTSRSLIAK
jgi:hypothetical protein